jgi:hypothetical protein
MYTGRTMLVKSLCTWHVVDRGLCQVHKLYMAKDEPLRWRRTCIRFWREYRDYTLEQAAEALARYSVTTTHASLGRIERGVQMPKIEMIEALASLYRTDIHKLLNERPPSPRGDIAPQKVTFGRPVALPK